MNGKKAKLLRKLSGFDPHKQRWYKHLTRRHKGRVIVIKGTHVATGARRRYRQMKKLYWGESVTK
jgi:hypothetical protein